MLFLLVGLVALTFWLLAIFTVVGLLKGFLSKKEAAYCVFMMDSAGCLLNFLGALNQLGSGKSYFWFLWDVVFCYMFGRWARRDYKRWKNMDDDDEKKKRRRAWVKNHLPKPYTKPIPVPI